jgi:hypothetical protein
VKALDQTDPPKAVSRRAQPPAPEVGAELPNAVLEPARPARFCTGCGTARAPEDRFCRHCGQALA